MGIIVSLMPENKRTPKLSNTRTDRDWIMIVLGVCLVIFFLVGGYLSCGKKEESTSPRLRGPVKDPARLGASSITPHIGAIVLRRDLTPPPADATP
jgi:hypothetical protein